MIDLLWYLYFLVLLLGSTHFLLKTLYPSGMPVQSLSLREIVILSLVETDRIGFIKDYYDLKHRNISSMIKGVSSVILLNLGIIVKNHYDMGMTRVRTTDSDFPLILLTFLLILVNVYLVAMINRCMHEYKTAVKFYNILTI